MQKKGVSPVVAEVLLVLLTIAAVSIVATFVINFVGPTLNESTECAKYQNYFSFKEEFSTNEGTFRYNCKQSNLVGASVKVSEGIESDEQVIGFELVFSDEQGLTTIVMVNETSPCEGEVKMLGGCIGELRIPGEGNTYTYVYNGGDKTFKTAEVYPVLGNGRVCDKSDQIELITCGENVNLAE